MRSCQTLSCPQSQSKSKRWAVERVALRTIFIVSFELINDFKCKQFTKSVIMRSQICRDRLTGVQLVLCNTTTKYKLSNIALLAYCFEKKLSYAREKFFNLARTREDANQMFLRKQMKKRSF